MKKAGSTERLNFMGLYCSVFCQFLRLSSKLGFALTLWEASQICFLLGVSFKFFKRLESGALHCKELLFAGIVNWILCFLQMGFHL